MLHHLHIENYALIKHSDIDFSDGFVAITGETGAGKSIMLGALSLLLGQRADVKVLHDPEHKCIVEAMFKVTPGMLRSLFEDNDVDYNDDGTIIIRREILPSAKSRAFVNDTPVQLNFLRLLGSSLIDIHSQHATLLLGESGYQTSLLDSLSNDKSALPEYKEAYHLYSTLKQKLEQLTIQEQQNRKDYDYNKFLFDELYAASLDPDEQDKLEQESSLLANAEEIKQSISQVVNICDGDEDSALARLNAAKSSLNKIASFDPQLQSLLDRLESAVIELDDIVSTLDSKNQGIAFSPMRQQEVDERLDLIYRLEKKHNVDNINALLSIQQQLDNLLNQANDNDREIQKTMEAVDKAYKSLQRQASKLTSSRKEAAQKLNTDADVIINVQGDEPFIQKSQLETVKHLFDDPQTQIATLGKPFESMEAVENPNSPKIVTDINGYALYFSRSVIPYIRGKEQSEWLQHFPFLKHIGLYAYRREVLAQITKLPQSPLELAESLEQLRWLQNGYRIKVGLTDVETVGIDTPEDLQRAEQFILAASV